VTLGIPKRRLIIGAVLAGIGLIYVMGTDKQPAGAAGSSPTGCKVAVTADVLNARSAPASSAGIAGKYNKDAQIDAQPVVQDGFRKIADNKWAATEFLKPLDGSHCG
jgi:hypothetical protein